MLLDPAIYGNNNVKVYYNLNKSLPDTLQSVSANKELQEKFNMVSTQMVLVNKDMKADTAKQMINEIKDLDGVDGVIGLQELLGDNISKEMIPDDILSIFENDKYQLLIINSTYENATDESNALIQKVNEIVSKYDKNAIMAGEGPLMNDLVKIADHEF